MKTSTVARIYRRRYSFSRRELERLARACMADSAVPVPLERDNVLAEWDEYHDVNFLTFTVDTVSESKPKEEVK